jgi:ATP-dependent RNA helicase DeaD
VSVEENATASTEVSAEREPAERATRSRLFLSLGEQDGADETKVREAVAALAPGVELRKVEVRRSHSFLEVAPEVADGAVQALHGKDWNGKPLTAEKARRRRR